MWAVQRQSCRDSMRWVTEIRRCRSRLVRSKQVLPRLSEWVGFGQLTSSAAHTTEFRNRWESQWGHAQSRHGLVVRNAAPALPRGKPKPCDADPDSWLVTPGMCSRPASQGRSEGQLPSPPQGRRPLSKKFDRTGRQGGVGLAQGSGRKAVADPAP